MIKSSNDNKISLGTTYYNNPDCILNFIDNHLPYVDELIIVDDGSKEDKNILKYINPTSKIRIFKVLKDYGFNSHGCRNLIMAKANNEFVILLDSDREIYNPIKAFSVIRKTKLRLDTIYKFSVNPMHWGLEGDHISVNDFLISKNFFFSVGGYDEELIGIRTGDREFSEQLLKLGKEKLIEDVKVRFTRGPTLLMTDSSELRSSKDKNEIPIGIYNKIKKRKICPKPNKKILTFEWEEVI